MGVDPNVLVKQLTLGLLCMYEGYKLVYGAWDLIEGRRQHQLEFLFDGLAKIGTAMVTFPFVLIVLGVPELSIWNWHVALTIGGALLVLSTGPIALRMHMRARSRKENHENPLPGSRPYAGPAPRP